jgi:drug/metabolite transporter (DMT)-like permease
MSAPVLMVLSTLLFSLMAVCVKLASAQYTTGEIVFYRGVVGAMILAFVAWRRPGGTLKTAYPMMHVWRCAVGVLSLGMWFYALGNLPIATAMTLNYMSSVWMSLFLIGGAMIFGSARVDGRLVGTILLGFIGVGLILRPTMAENQLWHGLIGLMSGVFAAFAYLQVGALGKVGEPEYRVVFYFSLGGAIAGGVTMLFTGISPHDWKGAALLLAVGVLAAAAQLSLTRAYSIGKPLVNASLQYLGIAFSFIFGVLLFGDKITWMALAGMLLIVAAGLAATLLRSRAVPAPPNSTLES